MATVMRRPNLRPTAEVWILAGGLSSRMGRDKATLRLGGRTILSIIRQSARMLGFPVHALRRDRIPRCGPIGGIYTALTRSRAAHALFLSCDMPLVSGRLMARVLAASPRPGSATFTEENGELGFPFVVHRDAVGQIRQMIDAKRFALRDLAAVLRARRVRVPRHHAPELLNINTPKDWEDFRRKFCDPAGVVKRRT